MLKVGVTGGIGSGKTTVCKIFEKLGIPVYYADERAKLLMVENPALIQKIKALFGAKAYFKNGSLNRKYIASFAFTDKQKLAQLNAVVHPVVFEDTAHWQKQHENFPYTIKEAALLIESGSYKNLDKLILVTAPIEVRLQRVLRRDGLSEAAIRRRMESQMSEAEKAKYADFTINNDGSESLIRQVWTLHQQLLQLAK